MRIGSAIHHCNINAMVLAVVMALGGATSFVQGKTTDAAPVALASFVRVVKANGPTSTLPPHLSALLGLSRQEQATPVRQAVIRDGDRVRTLNVPTDHGDDVVLMSYDTGSHATRAFLTTATGMLLKAISYQAGEAPKEQSSVEAREDFSAEWSFWLALARKSSAAAGS